MEINPETTELKNMVKTSAIWWTKSPKMLIKCVVS